MEIKGNVYNYLQYLEQLKAMVLEEKTSGNNQSKELIGFTSLNQTRMLRINKTFQLNPLLQTQIENLNHEQTWVVIAAAWCGDCAQNLPVIGKISEASKGRISLKIIERDENLNWLEKYHTNGSKSIPKVIAFNKDNVELFTWGPRPQEAQNLVLGYKQNPGNKSWHQFEIELHTWYAKNKSTDIQLELLSLLANSENVPNQGN